MDITVRGGALYGKIRSIPSKSEAHRALICAALADGPTKIGLPEINADLEATANCLRALGAKITGSEGLVSVVPAKRIADCAQMDCAESGSTLRFLLPVSMALTNRAHFSGSGSLPGRPLDGLMEAMEENGTRFSDKRLPFSAEGRLRAGTYEIAGDVSSQYISGLLMALPLLDGDSRITLTSPLCSAPYVDMTLDMLGKFGVTARRGAEGFYVKGGQSFRSPGAADMEGDWSAAAFFLAAGAAGGDVTVSGLRTDSLQGDRAAADILKSFGAEVEASDGSVRVRHAPLKACSVDVSSIPDLFPALAVLATCAKGKTVLYNAGHLRYKESDRLASTASLINSLGGRAEEFPERLEIEGKPLTGGRTEAFGDHRMAMAAAIAASLCRGKTTISGAEAVGKSYPGFFRDFAALGGIAVPNPEEGMI